MRPDRPARQTGFSRYPWWRRWFGRRSERFAARFLRKLGYRILAHNPHDRLGELDLLALDGLTIVVVEVRSSESKSLNDIASTVDRDKQRRISEATRRFLHRRGLRNIGVRFDVIALRWPPGDPRPEVRHVRNAFESTGWHPFSP
jgi:putative endonuclease